MDRRAFERDMRDELNQHIENRAEDLVRLGLSREQALRRARVEFGAVENYKEQCRESRGLRFFDDLRADLLFFARSLRRNALLSVTVVLTLALGIGMDTGVFTLINAYGLRPIVDKDPASYFKIFAEYTGDPIRRNLGPVTTADYAAFKSARSVRELAAVTGVPATLGRDNPAGVQPLLVTCNFFSVHGLERPKLGRLFAPEECAYPRSGSVIVLSEEIWRNRFAADPTVIGRAVQINDQMLTVIGVAPAGTPAKLNRTMIVWIPYTMQPLLGATDQFASDAPWLNLAGRLKPGSSHRDAEAELGVIALRQDRLHPGRHTFVSVTNGSTFQEPGARQLALWVIPLTMGALTLVLLIACLNVTTLLLSRAAARRHEIAVRLSLGAARARLLRMLFTESMILAGAAGVCSLFLAYRIPVFLNRLMSSEPGNLPLSPDWRVFAYTCAVSLLAGCIAGFAPALESMKVDLSASLKGSGGMMGGAGRSGSRTRSFLVGAQIAMSLVLLAGAGVLVRVYSRLMTAPPGFETKQALFVRLRLRGAARPRAPWIAFHQTLARRVEAIPGVQSVAFSPTPLFNGQSKMQVTLPGQAQREVYSNLVSPKFFETFGIPILQGRGFTEADGAGLAVVSESCARSLWPGESAIGKTMATANGPLEVIGVARDINTVQYGGPDGPVVYPLWSRDTNPYPMYPMYPMVIRFSGAQREIERAAAALLNGAAPELSATSFGTIQAMMDQQIAGFWRLTSMVGTLGVVALALATMGIYGVVAFAATRRTKELGIRVALGAKQSDIIREMLVSSMKPVWGGLGIGLLMTLGASVPLEKVLARAPFPVDTRDPLAYAAVALLLASAATLATLLPARRAAGVDPLKALRVE